MSDNEVIEGKVVKIVYSNESNGFLVAKTLVDERILTIVGNKSILKEGDCFRAIGVYDSRGKFGKQFKFESVTLVDDITDDGLASSLCGLVFGLGQARARRFIFELGGAKKSIEWLDNTTEDTIFFDGHEFPYIPNNIIIELLKEWKNSRIAREIDASLSSFDITESIKNKLIAKYGSSAVDVCKNKPYKLIKDIEGIGFLKADDIAIKSGISLESDDRIDAACFHVFNRLAEDGGHTVLSIMDVSKALCDLFMKRACSSSFGKNPLKATIESINRLVDYNDLIKVEKEKYSLTTYYNCEKSIIDSLKRITESLNSAPLQNVEECIKLAQDNLNIKLSEDQVNSIHQVSNKGVVVITGGPGVGKTSNCKAIVYLADSSNLSIVLCAPTARAAKRLQESTGRDAYTIHKLLEYQNGEFTRNRSNPISADFIICDEQSMTDSLLMDSLLKAVRDKCRLVLVGDVNQLPPVGPGSPFKDIINSEVIPVTKLTTIHRQSEKSDIVKNSHKILNGFTPSNSETGSRENGCFHFIESDKEEESAETLVDVVSSVKEEFNVEPLDTLVISPMRKGVCGVDSLNKLLQEKLNPKSPEKEEFLYNKDENSFRVGDKVRQTKNEYNRGIVNGDIGKVCWISPDKKAEFLLSVDFGFCIVRYTRKDLMNLTLSYCGTVHSAQGSESPVVVIALTNSHYVMLSRTLIYTAATRAKNACIVIGSRKALNIACKNVKDYSRKTALSILFKEKNEHA